MLLLGAGTLQAQVIIEVEDINFLAGATEDPPTVEAFPNPVQDDLTIRSYQGPIDHLTITDAQGTVWLEEDQPEGSYSVPLTPGLYWISCRIGNDLFQLSIVVI
ncbi:MAG: T9SS type A sorting domain-containing protein [Bacteroidota bacterium]